MSRSCSAHVLEGERVETGRLGALRISALSSVLFFFFQAEDGIRDVAVTGVQTCALPIFPEPFSKFVDARLRALAGSLVILLQFLIIRTVLDFLLGLRRLRAGGLQKSGVAAFPFVLESLPRALAEIFIPKGPEEREIGRASCRERG